MTPALLSPVTSISPVMLSANRAGHLRSRVAARFLTKDDTDGTKSGGLDLIKQGLISAQFPVVIMCVN